MANRALLGGLLSGLGQGLVLQAKQDREDALERARELRRELEIEQEHDFQRERDRTAAEERRGLLSATTQDTEGNLYGITEGGDVKKLGVRAPLKKTGSGDDSGMSAGDQRLWNAAVQRHTTEGGLDQGKTTDWESVARDLRKQGREDLARLASSPEAPKGVDTDSDAYARAQQMAEDWVNSQARTFHTDKTDFAAYGGNRAQAKIAKTLEFYRQLTGNDSAEMPTEDAAAAPAGRNVANAAPAGNATGKTPRGAGTQVSPYEPTTMDEFNAIPSGAVYRNPADGKLYRKK